MSNKKVLKVIDELYRHPNEWHDIQSLAYRTNLTSKQISSIAQPVNCSCIVRMKGPSDKLLIKVEGDEDTLRSARRETVKKTMNLSDGDIDFVYGLLSPAGWTSTSDIMRETGYSLNLVLVILSVLGNIESKTIDKSIMYRKIPMGW